MNQKQEQQQNEQQRKSKNIGIVKDKTYRSCTIQDDQPPIQLSFHNMKLVNFIELQLTDLMDTIQQINGRNYQNQLKQNLSRSNSVFYQMETLFNDLDMNFLYQQVKKLISCYRAIFVLLIEKLQKNGVIHEEDKNLQKQIEFKFNVLKQQISENMENSKIEYSQKNKKQQQRLRGLHLFNQSYVRGIDYNVQQFRQLRQKIKYDEEKNKGLNMEEQKKLLKLQILKQLNDYSHLTMDGQDIAVFINREKKFSEVTKSMSVGDELQKIALLFKQSHNQALQFLRNEMHLPTFHQLTSGFNSLLQNCKNEKEEQLALIQDKVKQIFQFIKNKHAQLEQIIKEQEKQIQMLKSMKNKKTNTREYQTQTYYNFDNEIKQLVKRAVEAQMMNNQLKIYINKINDEHKKQMNTLQVHFSQKQSANRQLKTAIQQKGNYIITVQRKLKIISQSIKSMGVRNPIENFKCLSDDMKKLFIEELKQQGFIPNRDKQLRKANIKHNNKNISGNLELNDVNALKNCDDNNIGKENKSRGNIVFQEHTFRNGEFRHGMNGSMKKIPGNSLRMSLPVYDQGYDLSFQPQTNKQQSRQNIVYNIDKLNSKKMISIRKKNEEDFIDQSNQNNQRKSKISNLNSQVSILFESVHKQEIIQQPNKTNQPTKTQKFQSQQLEKRDKKTENLNTKKIKLKIAKQINSEIQRQSEMITKNQQQQLHIQRQEQLVSNKQNESEKQKHDENKLQNKQNQQNQCHEMSGRKEESVKNINIKNKKSKQKLKQKKNGKNKQSKQYKENVNFEPNENNQVDNQNDNNPQSIDSQKDKGDSNPIHYPENNQYYIDSLKQQHQSQEVPNIKQKDFLAIRRGRSSCSLQKNGSKLMDLADITHTHTASVQTCCEKNENSKHTFSLTNQFNFIISTNFNRRAYLSIQKQKRFSFNNQNIQQFEIKQNQDNYFLSTRKYTQQRIKNNTGNDEDKKGVEKMKGFSKRSKTNIKNYSLNKDSGTYLHSVHQPNIANLSKQELQLLIKQLLVNAKNGNGKQNNSISFDIKKKNHHDGLKSQSNHILHKFGNKTCNMMGICGNKNRLKKQLEEQFGDEQLIEVSKQCQTVQEFGDKLAKMHDKCGNNCKHLQRYIDILVKLRNDASKNKRQIIKLHIQDMNEKLALPEIDCLNFPSIKRN